MLTISGIEDVCDAKGITLVMHPAVRRAVKAYEESFYIGAYSYLRDGTDGLYFLPLASGGHVRLQFSKRFSPRGHAILRVEPVGSGALDRIRASPSARKA